MNRRRNEPRALFWPIAAVLLAAVIGTFGGVRHVSFKNSQVRISREIDAVNRGMEHDRLDIRTTQMRMDELLNRFVIRKQLEENGSMLRPIASNMVEEVDPLPSLRSVAASHP